MTDINAQKLKTSFGGYSTAGVKPENEDAFAAFQPEGQNRLIKGALACLADGASTSEHAKQASQTSVQQFIDDYLASPDTWAVKTCISQIVSSLNSWLYHYGVQTLARKNAYVTTFAGVIVKSTTAHLFHVGDSRIYRYRPGGDKLRLLTRDHTSTMGDRDYLTRALGLEPSLEVDYRQEEVREGDVFVLTSDGCHNFVSPAEIRQALNGDKNLEKVAKTVVDHALQSGSDDNASCLFLRVDTLPLASIDEVHRQLTRLAIPPVMDVGMSIDGYEVQKVIYNGTRSHLYLVQHPDHSRPYVLKAPSENFSDDPQYLDSFSREQWVGSRINHNNVMKVYPTPPGSKFLYLLMEYVDGETLRQRMYDRGVLSLEETREIMQQVVTAMRAFQRLEMLHRDLKPENIMITLEGVVKVIDFGTVKVRGLAEIKQAEIEDYPVGAVDYIAPEYLLDNAAGFQSDVFSLGVMTYEMLSGKLPYNMSHANRRMPKSLNEWKYRSICEGEIKLPRWLDYALKKATHPTMNSRHEAFSEFMQDLQKPNYQLIEQSESLSLLEKNPVLVWKVISGILAFIVLVQAVLLSQK